MDINFQNIIDKFRTNQKGFTYILVGIAAIAGLAYYFTQIHLPEAEEEAQKAMFMAQLQFENKNFEKALNGDSKTKGFNYIKENYTFTKAKSLASLYAGICNLNLGKYDKAIEDLKGFSTNISEVQAVAYSALGDAYAEKKNMGEAISFYEKAASETKNNALAPKLAMKAAKALESNKEYQKAADLLRKVKNEFPNSQEAGMADIYIAKVESQIP